MRNFIQPGKTLTMPAPVGGVVSGALVIIAKIFGIAATTAAEGEPFDLDTGGVYELPKIATEVWVAGDEIYVTVGGVMSKSASGNTKVGVAAAAAANPSGSGHVRLNDNF